jgi:phage baseplate assembly protein W
MAKEFLGTGMKFPPEVDKATGRFRTVSADQAVKESVWIILFTQLTERFVRPDFGSDILSFTFMDTGITQLNILRQDITRTILSQEPRIMDVDVRTEFLEKQGCVVVNIGYTVRGSNTRDNLVFPFYLDSADTGTGAAVDEAEFYDPQINGPVYYDENGELWEP